MVVVVVVVAVAVVVVVVVAVVVVVVGGGGAWHVFTAEAGGKEGSYSPTRRTNTNHKRQKDKQDPKTPQEEVHGQYDNNSGPFL